MPGSEVEANLQSLIESRTAGDPDDESIRFTDLTPTRIESELTAMQTPASNDLIRRWMDEQNLRLRKIDKVIAGGHSEDRDAQFLNIASLTDTFKAEGNPVFSIDTKAKEHLGKLFRQGRVHCTAPFLAFDHDFPSLAESVLIPHGIYTVFLVMGFVIVGM